MNNEKNWKGEACVQRDADLAKAREERDLRDFELSNLRERFDLQAKELTETLIQLAAALAATKKVDVAITANAKVAALVQLTSCDSSRKNEIMKLVVEIDHALRASAHH